MTTVGWIFYAYMNPNSPSGLWLIDHRPSKIVEMVSNRLSELKKDNDAANNMSRLEEHSVA